MISEKTAQRMKDMNIVCLDAVGLKGEIDEGLDADINTCLDAIEEHDRQYPYELTKYILDYIKETKKMRIAGKDTSHRLSDEELEAKWRKEHEND